MQVEVFAGLILKREGKNTVRYKFQGGNTEVFRLVEEWTE